MVSPLAIARPKAFLIDVIVPATSRADIFSKDGLKPLVDNILSDDNELRVESLRTILAIIKTVQNQNAVRESSAISMLLSIASNPESTDPVVLSLSLEILCRVAHDNST